MVDEPRPPAESDSPAEAGMTAGPGGAVELTGLRNRVAELEDQLLRALADLDNVRRRSGQQADRVRTEERSRVAAQWLPLVDNLDRALEAFGGPDQPAADPAAVRAGVEAVRDQALAILTELGYPRRTDLGHDFDPARHEAVAAVPVPPGSRIGAVVDVVRPGYGEGRQLLRPAAVVVATDGEAG